MSLQSPCRGRPIIACQPLNAWQRVRSSHRRRGARPRPSARAQRPPRRNGPARAGVQRRQGRSGTASVRGRTARRGDGSQSRSGRSASTKQQITGWRTRSMSPFSRSDVIDEFATAGQIVAASRTPLGRSGIGIGMRAGAKKPDIGTPEAAEAGASVGAVADVGVRWRKPSSHHADARDTRHRRGRCAERSCSNKVRSAPRGV